jgi:hypothetical protein
MFRPSFRIVAIIVVILIALGLRLRAVDLLPIDYDEDDYLLAGQHYAKAIVEGEWGEIIRYDYNLEHPPLAKLVYGVILSRLPQVPEVPQKPTSAAPAKSLPEAQFRAARLTSAAFGVLEVLVVAFLSPLAGLFLAIHTFTIKYTSQVYLEALPSLTSAIAVLAYVKSKGKWNGWLVFSAVALGLTVASKYMYCVAGIAILIHWLLSLRAPQGRSNPQLSRGLPFDYAQDKLQRYAPCNDNWGPIIAWGLLALAVFFVADPFLWPDPLGHLKASLLFNTAYSQSEHVQRAGLPLWQPFVWLAQSVPWHPGVFRVSLDVLITALALLGLKRLWQKHSIFAIWLAVALGFLLIWPTKWPQYILILTVPLSLAAADGFQATVWEPLSHWLRHPHPIPLPPPLSQKLGEGRGEGSPARSPVVVAWGHHPGVDCSFPHVLPDSDGADGLQCHRDPRWT